MTHNTIPLDNTYDYGKSLKKANIPEPQIDVLVARDQQTTQLILNTIEEKFATKHDFFLVRKDIDELKLSTKQDINELRLSTKHDFALVRKDIESIKSDAKMILWLIGAIAFVFTSTQLMKLLGF